MSMKMEGEILHLLGTVTGLRVTNCQEVPRGDSCFYPDSGKRPVATEGSEEMIVQDKRADYFDDKE